MTRDHSSIVSAKNNLVNWSPSKNFQLNEIRLFKLSHCFGGASLLARGDMILARGAGTWAKNWHVAMKQFLRLVLFLFRSVIRKRDTAARGLLVPLLILFSNVHSTASPVHNNTFVPYAFYQSKRTSNDDGNDNDNDNDKDNDTFSLEPIGARLT